MERGFGVARVEIDGAFERVRGAGEIAGALLRHAEKNSWARLRREKIDGFLQRRDGVGGSGIGEKDAEIQIGFRHFWIDGDRLFVLGASFGDLLQRGVGVGELKMRECDVGLFGDEFLQRRDRGGEIAFVDVALGFVEIVVERIVDGFFARLRSRRFRCGDWIARMCRAACRQSPEQDAALLRKRKERRWRGNLRRS